MKPFRIAHLNFIDEPGVTRKLREQASAARELGLPMDFYLISSDFKDHDEGNLKFRKRAQSTMPGRLRFLHSMLFGHEDLIGSYLDPAAYDAFVIRFGKLFLGQGITYRRWGSRIVTEHHTDEIAELLLKPTLGRRFLAAVSLQRSRKALGMVAGISAVTGEILGNEIAKSGGRPGIVVPNGVSVPAEPPPPRSLGPVEPIRIVFAAAAFQSWQGLDRLLAGLRRYSGIRPLVVNLAGKLDEDQHAGLQRFAGHARIRFEEHGILDPTAARQLYVRCHVGIAGLALLRNGLAEACPLKVRDYAAYGLPFAYAFVDPDIPADWPYALRLPADESPVDVDAIVRFAEGAYAAGDPGATMHAFALAHLDWKPKVQALYDFVRKATSGGEGEA
ncbi:MAG: hypothetical protein NT080_10465 [Spirochaetes bacterium]|nr:hypothetical protein [Spirochaetota bacterium]